MLGNLNSFYENRERRFNTTSRKFTFRNSAISASGIQTIHFESSDATSQKYLPFDNCQVKNQSGSDIWVYFNGNSANKFLVASNTIENFPPQALGGLFSVQLEDASASAIAANKIAVICWKEPPTQDVLIQKRFEDKYKRRDFV